MISTSRYSNRVRAVGLITLLALALSTETHGSTLTGAKIEAQFEFPTIGVPYGPSTVTPNSFFVGDGIEAVFDIETVTQFSVDFSASSLLITLTTSLDKPRWTDPLGANPSEQNGPVFRMVSGAFPTIANFSSTNGSVLAYLLNDKLYIDWRGWEYLSGYTVRVNFDTSPVPLPAALPLLAAGLGAMGLMGWRKKRKAAAA